MSASGCQCIGHFEEDCVGDLAWVVDVPDPTCSHPLHKEEA